MGKCHPRGIEVGACHLLSSPGDLLFLSSREMSTQMIAKGCDPTTTPLSTPPRSGVVSMRVMIAVPVVTVAPSALQDPSSLEHWH